MSNEVNSKLSVNNVDKALIKLSQNNEEVADNSLHIITIQEWKSWSITVNELKKYWENDAYDLSKIPTDRGKIFNLIFDTKLSCDFGCGQDGLYDFYGALEDKERNERLYSEYKHKNDGETVNYRNLAIDYIGNKDKIKKITFNSSTANCTTKPTKIETRVRGVVVE